MHVTASPDDWNSQGVFPNRIDPHVSSVSSPHSVELIASASSRTVAFEGISFPTFCVVFTKI